LIIAGHGEELEFDLGVDRDSVNILRGMASLHEYRETSRVFLCMHDDCFLLRPIQARHIHQYRIGRISETIGPSELKNYWHYTVPKTGYIPDQYGLDALN
jgi:hypothetical protein